MTITGKRLEEIAARVAKATGGKWVRKALGGCSTIITSARINAGDSRIPAYAYDVSRGFCVGYPFLDESGEARLDFVCFTHTDADFIAHAREDIPYLLSALTELQNPADEMIEAMGKVLGVDWGSDDIWADATRETMRKTLAVAFRAAIAVAMEGE